MKKGAEGVISTDLKQIFACIVKECPRSSTKMNLNADPKKDNILALLLNNVVTRFSEDIAKEFQKEFEHKDPGLSFLFAHLTSAISQRAFHEGRCHLQAAYALIELAKRKIFNASLICSRTGDPTTEHFYLLILEEHTSKILANQKDLFIRISKDRFNPASTFLDPWSNQLCRWDQFKAEDSYTKKIRVTDQALFKTLSHLFGSEEKIFERITWCLNRYETYLNSLRLDELAKIKVPNVLDGTDSVFNEEVELLTNPKKCLNKLLETIALYKAEFEKSCSKVSEKLLSTTSSFFKKSIDSQWKAYPSEQLLNTKYAKHDVWYLTLKKPDSQNAATFFNHLTDSGFAAEMKAAKENPSIVVDLTASK